MIVSSNGNIDQLKFFVKFIVEELDFIMWIEKESLTLKKCSTKIKCECKNCW